MSETNPIFSVVTCCYNQGPYLKDNIEYVLKQKFPSFEHIIVDDGSTDNTAEVCRQYPHVRYIYQTNAGQSAALNHGFREAKGEIIAWVNSDDYHEPGAFTRVAAELDALRNKQIISGMAKVVNQDGHFMWMLKNGEVGFNRLLMHPRLYPFNGWCVMPCQPSVFFHRKMVEEIGYLDTKLKYGMDYEYWLRAMRNGYRFNYIPQVFSSYRYHPTSNTMKGYDTFLGEWQAVSQKYLDLLTPSERRRAELWWKFVRVECFFVQRHKLAIQHIAVRFGHNPYEHPLRRRLAVIARASLIAPWIPLTVLCRSFGPHHDASI